MNKFIIATSFNVQNRNKDKIGEMLNNAYGSSKDVTLINVDNMSKETLDKFIDMGGIDCFIFSAEYINSSENKETLKRILTKDIEQGTNTKLMNIYDSTDEISKNNSIEVGDMLVDDFNGSLFHYDINTESKILGQNLKGIKNDALRTKEQLKVKETEIFDLTKKIVEKIDNEKDHYTAGHIKSVSLIADEMAIKMGLSDEERDILKVGALLHDIGKEDVSDRVLKKPERLTDEEFGEMKSHVVFGEVELSQYNLGKFERSKSIASEHHERYDGRGYPRGLKGEEIDKLSRIVSIADAAQAMFGRSYQAGKTKDQLIDQLNENAGTQFDPNMVGTLIEILEKEPESIGVSYDAEGKISYEVKDIDDILNDDVEANKDKEQTTMNDFFANLKKGVVKTPTEYTSNKEGNNSREKENKDYI